MVELGGKRRTENAPCSLSTVYLSTVSFRNILKKIVRVAGYAL